MEHPARVAEMPEVACFGAAGSHQSRLTAACVLSNRQDTCLLLWTNGNAVSALATNKPTVPARSDEGVLGRR